MARELLSPQARAAVFDPPIHLFFVNRSNAYIKAGLILGELTDPAREQLTLFEGGDDEKRLAVMQALDTVNRRWGRNTLFYAASDGETLEHAPRAQVPVLYDEAGRTASGSVKSF